MKREQFKVRTRIVFAGVFVFAMLLGVRLYFVQIVSGAEFSGQAERQYVRPRNNLFDRGSIYFTDKNDAHVPAASLKHGYLVAIIPDNIEKPHKVYQKLNTYIDIDSDTFIARASKVDDPYEEIARRLSAQAASSIEDMDIEGVQVFKHRWRHYPGAELAAHTVGFLGYTEDKREGQYGLERSYESVLSRTNKNTYANFFVELFSNIKGTLIDGQQSNGNVVTTIEPHVQAFLESELGALNKELESREAGAIILNPRTGEIYALASTPTFDLNAFGEVENPRVYTNPLVENVYEMGSIMKPLTMAAGIDSGAVTATTTYVDKGYLELNTERIHNFDKKGRGRVSMQEVLNQSLNTGAAFVMHEMGIDVFSDYMRSYGFGETTGIMLPNEGSGLVSNLSSTREIEHATASFGQGIALTPVQIVRAHSALANNGRIVSPHVVKALEFENGVQRDVSHPELRRVISAAASEEVSRMLVAAVDEALLDGQVALDHHTIAAKTGTAQIPNPEEGGYYEDRFLHSFVGYFPAFDPRFLVFIYVREPKGVQYANQSLTYPFMDITKFLINYYNVPPDR